MATKKLIAICQSGGEFVTEKDGSLSYRGGDARAIDVDDQTKFNDFKMEVEEMFDCSMSTMSIKYFVPGNRKTLVTVSTDKDLKRMIKFHADSITADVYIIMEDIVAPDISNMPASRSSRTTLSEEVPLFDPPLGVVDDTTQPSFPLEPSLDIIDDTNHIDVDVDLPPDIASILPISVIPYEKHAKGAEQWQNTITGVGQRFSSVTELRESLRKYAIAHQFAFKYKKNDSRRVTAKCKVEGCPWRIHASRLSTTELISIKKMHPTHTCGGPAMTGGYQATSSWVASVIKEKLKVFPDYKPKDIVNDIKQEYRIQLNYSQARRGKEIALGQLRGSYKDAYSQLPSLCDRIMETNPGSVATFTTKEDSSFHRLFISFHASLSGFVQGCRPLLFLDSIPLKSKYQGMLLTATAADGDDGVFPVAFAVVDAETNDNWYWFLLQVKSAVSTSCPLTVIADRQKGLRESIPEIFVDSYHGYCLRYLTEELVRELKGQFSHEVKRIMSEDLYRAASAPKPEDFHACVESIKMISLEAYNWVMQSEPKNWANTFFQGARYNHMTSDFGERFYSWASDAHELPITRMVDVIRGKIMELIYTRRADSDHWLTRLTPSMEEKLEKESLKACSFQLRLTTGSIFEVQGDSTEVVDIDRWDCSCKGWQLTGLPCCHAIAVIRCIGQSPYDFCSRYFATESYRLTYAESVQPIPDVDSPMQKDSSQALMQGFWAQQVHLQRARVKCCILDHIKEQVHHILYIEQLFRKWSKVTLGAMVLILTMNAMVVLQSRIFFIRCSYIVDNTNQIDEHIDLPPDIASVLPYEKHVNGAEQWQKTITGVGQRFSGVAEFRESLRKYAIGHQFSFMYENNDCRRVTDKCKVEGCSWRIHASRLSTTQLISVKKMNPTHTCGMNLKYHQAWRAKEIVMEQLQGSYKDAYSRLPYFCDMIMETNPGSLATFATKEDSNCHRLFISFHASLSGFVQGCRPLLFLDSIPLMSKYQGMSLTATAADGDDDAENNDYWRWFLLQLKSALSTSCSLTIIAARQLRKSISEIFKGSYHDLYQAASAPKPEDFRTSVESIKGISLEAYNWVMQSEPKNAAGEQ
ncbi:hypothetical protein V6N13_066673 [Hibiscus sabdariffa]